MDKENDDVNNIFHKDQPPAFKEMLTNKFWGEDELFQLVDDQLPVYLKKKATMTFFISIYLVLYN